MLTTTPRPGTDLVTIEFSGGLDGGAMRACQETLVRVQREHGTLRLLAIYGDVDLRAMEPAALWEDLKNVPVIRHVERCAIVADQEWVRRVSTVAAPFVPGELRTFAPDELAAARAWIDRPTTRERS